MWSTPDLCGMFRLLFIVVTIVSTERLHTATKVPSYNYERALKTLRISDRLMNSNGECTSELIDAENRVVQAIHPLETAGQWVSTGCEIHPGGKFVVRDFHVYKTGNFKFHQYFYEDQSCTQPSFVVSSHGDIQHYTRSWMVPGGSEVKFALKKVTLMPYNKPSAKNLTLDLRARCYVENDRPFMWPWLHEYQEYLIFHNSEPQDLSRLEEYADLTHTHTANLDCLSAVNVTVAELKLMRMEEVKESATHFEKRLYLGYPVWQSANRSWLEPTSFSQPLVNAYEISGCRNCERIKDANPISPPRFRARQHGNDFALNPPFDHLRGEWLSLDCESHLFGIYSARQMTFDSTTFRWKVRQRFFNDPLCKRPSFTLIAEGQYIAGPSSPSLEDTQQLVYKIDRVKLMPQNRATVENFRHSPNCGGHRVRWRKGRTVDVTEFGGCGHLGVRVPSLTPDIVRVVRSGSNNGGDNKSAGAKRLLLYTGDYTSAQYAGVPYPTAFQRPLVKCEETSVVVTLTLGNEEVVEEANVPHNRYHSSWRQLRSSTSPLPHMCNLSLLAVLLPLLLQSIGCC